jgi:hypothetical protein
MRHPVSTHSGRCMVISTELTLLLLPALYAAWFRVQPEPAAAEPLPA